MISKMKFLDKHKVNGLLKMFLYMKKQCLTDR